MSLSAVTFTMIPRKRLYHVTPHWISTNAEYFVTICANPRGQNHFCRPETGAAILQSIRLYNENHNWWCDLAVLMPDHVHLLVSFPPDKILSRVVGLWKRSLTRTLGLSWQRNFFEHRMRNDENIQQKATYVLENPVRAGLVKEWKDWPYVWLTNS